MPVIIGFLSCSQHQNGSVLSSEILPWLMYLQLGEDSITNRSALELQVLKCILHSPYVNICSQSHATAAEFEDLYNIMHHPLK